MLRSSEKIIFLICLIAAAILWADDISTESDEDWWIGNKLGPKDYIMELEVIEQAKIDLNEKLNLPGISSRKPLLCACFSKAVKQPSDVLSMNMAILGNHCDWAIVVYSGSRSTVKRYCGDFHSVPNVVHCRRSPDSFPNEEKMLVNDSIPKTVLYQELLPYLPNYEKIFLMDEDISLVGFNISRFFDVWRCSFYPLPAPLIVQPLIKESKQYFYYVNYKAWRAGRKRSVVATAVGLVEQQVPFFDAIFFEWFVRRVLSMTKEYSLYYGVDWGHDRSWCNAARMYSRHVLQWPKSSIPCGVLPGGTPLHHLNTHAMNLKRKNRNQFRKNGNHILEKYKSLFPTWVLEDIVFCTNPLDKTYGKSYKKIFNRSLDVHCPSALQWLPLPSSVIVTQFTNNSTNASIVQ